MLLLPGNSLYEYLPLTNFESSEAEANCPLKALEGVLGTSGTADIGLN